MWTVSLRRKVVVVLHEGWRRLAVHSDVRVLTLNVVVRAWAGAANGCTRWTDGRRSVDMHRWAQRKPEDGRGGEDAEVFRLLQGSSGCRHDGTGLKGQRSTAPHENAEETRGITRKHSSKAR
jgi:hypothetical protein